LGIAARVHFAGEIPAEAVAVLLKSCDAFVFPSLWEGLPMAAIEALHARAAIVASDIPATREALGQAALMVPPGDAPALAAGIRRVLEDPDLARTLRERAARRAGQFSAGRMINGYDGLIRGYRAADVPCVSDSN
jgi:glycosyltransferase involved in cell wall biosynthesis